MAKPCCDCLSKMGCLCTLVQVTACRQERQTQCFTPQRWAEVAHVTSTLERTAQSTSARIAASLRTCSWRFRHDRPDKSTAQAFQYDHLTAFAIASTSVRNGDQCHNFAMLCGIQAEVALGSKYLVAASSVSPAHHLFSSASVHQKLHAVPRAHWDDGWMHEAGVAPDVAELEALRRCMKTHEPAIQRGHVPACTTCCRAAAGASRHYRSRPSLWLHACTLNLPQALEEYSAGSQKGESRAP